MTLSDAALLADKHLAGPNMPSIQAITLNRDLWCKVAGERLAEIGRLKDALDAMRRERDEALAGATFAEALKTGPDHGGELARLRAELARLRAERDAAKVETALAMADLEEAVAERSTILGDLAVAVAERDRARAACGEVTRASVARAEMEDEDEEDEDKDSDELDDIDNEEEEEEDPVLAAISDQFSSFDLRLKSFGARLGEVERSMSRGDARTAAERDDGSPSFSDKIDFECGRLHESIRVLRARADRAEKDHGRRLMMCETLVKNLTSQVETILARFDHPKLIELLKPANGEPASWSSNIQAKAGVTP